MSAIAKITGKLAQHPHIRFVATATEVRVPAANPNGFTVWLSERPDGFTVAFEGWHEEFSSEEDALNCFAWGLTPECRLRVELRGAFPYRWTAESMQNGGWVADSTTGLLLFPFWRRARTEYRQNDWVPAA
jgi:hypothetical protein